MLKCKAVEVVPEKFWITYDSKDKKTGTIRIDSNGSYICYLLDGSKVEYSKDEINDIFNFESKSELNEWHQTHVFGYPVGNVVVYDSQEKENLPCFIKTKGSKVNFAAGYYGINFDNTGWVISFCPKFTTLKKNEFVGPFKTEVDASLAAKRKERQDNQD